MDDVITSSTVICAITDGRSFQLRTYAGRTMIPISIACYSKQYCAFEITCATLHAAMARY